jgi:nucleotide-binding universal stress UspA family protein
MNKKILVAVDFTELGRAAISSALELALALQARVDVLHVLTALEMGDTAGDSVTQLKQLEEAVRAKLAREADALAVAGRLGECLIGSGDPATRVLLAASEHAADLIVLGSHGRSGLSRLMLGSTAESVVRRARVPVLVVKQPRQVRTVGVAVDLGPDSAFLLATAFELAGSLAVRVHLLHAYAPMRDEYGAGISLQKSLHQQACESLRDLASPYARLPTMGDCVAEPGDPTVVILELVEKNQVDLLVLGTQSRQGLSRLVVGSVAEAVLREAHLPVLIAKHAALRTAADPVV